MVVVGVFPTACQNSIFVPLEISVPEGLTADQVEAALIAALANFRIVPGLDPEQLVPDRMIKDLYGPGVRPRTRWSPERREPGLMYAGCQWRSHYLQIALHFDTQRVKIKLASSRNLDQQGDSIHDRAIILARRLADQITISLGQMTAYRGLS
jgi:hypothetical protein